MGRGRLTRSLVVLSALAVPWLQGVVASPASAEATASPQALRPPVLWGAHVDFDAAADGRSLATLSQLETATGRTFALDRQYHAFSDSVADAATLDDKAHGRVPLLSYLPRNNQTGVTLYWPDITAGRWDAKYLSTLAQQLIAFNSPIDFIFHHEADSALTQYCPVSRFRAQCATPQAQRQQFAAAFAHVVTYFRAARVPTTVRYVIVMGDGSFSNGDITDLYPGDSFVDEVGVDGYNYGSCQGGASKWRSFAAIFNSTASFAVAHHKALVVAEYGASELGAPAGQSKSQWLTDMATTVKTDPLWQQLPAAALVAFDADAGKFPHCLWWVDSTTATFATWKSIALDPYFGGPGGTSWYHDRRRHRGDDHPGDDEPSLW